MRMAIFIALAIVVVFLVVLPALNKVFDILQNISEVAEKQTIEEEKDEENNEL